MTGYDNWDEVIEHAEAAREAGGVTNVTFLNPDRAALTATPAFDLVLTADVLHDLPRPDLMAKSVFRMLKPGGTWLIVESHSYEDFDKDRLRPNAPIQYGFSLVACLQAGTSTPDGMGLGIAGLAEPALGRLLSAAGFRQFSRVPGLQHPVQAFYMARP